METIRSTQRPASVRRQRPFGSFLLALSLLVLPLSVLPSAGASGAPDLPASLAERLKEPHSPGELLVKWRDQGVPSETPRTAMMGLQDGRVDLIERAGASLRRNLPELRLTRVQTSEESLAATWAHLTADPRVEWVEPNYLLTLDFTPDDPYYAGYQQIILQRMGLEEAWEITQGDPDIVVAVIDTGMDFDHEDLLGSVWVNDDEIPDNELDDDGNGYVDDVRGWDFVGADNQPDDGHGHGTHVAGIVAARTNNGLGIAGMAGRASVMVLSIFHPGGFGTYADLIEAIIYATDNGARVINMSLGATSYSRGEEAAVNYAWDHDVLLVAAAGNNNNDAAHYPSGHEKVIAVSSVTSSDTRSSFSSYGEAVDLCAPGSSIMSTMRWDGYGRMSGTSMATPHVSGLAALVMARNPTLTVGQVRQILEANCDDLGTPGWDPYYGHGRINARLALEATPDPMPPFPTREPPAPQPMWPDPCQELVVNGDFESTNLGPWQGMGEASLDPGVAYSGDASLHLTSSIAGSGAAWQSLSVPSDATSATLFFAMRLLSSDGGYGSDPSDPFEDKLKAAFRDAAGSPLMELLRAGNTSDGAPDLPWDEYIYRLTPEDLGLLRDAGTVQLHFHAQNDEDDHPTSFHIDDVRFCVGQSGMKPRVYVPLVAG